MSGARRRAANALVAALLAAAGPAPAAQYQVSAIAFNQGDTHESLADPLALADAQQSGGLAGAGDYHALADLSTGVLEASVEVANGTQMSFPAQARSAARFAETIAFQQSLAGPVTIRASIGADANAPTPQFAPGFPAASQTFYYLDVAGCRTTVTETNSVPEDTSSCPNAQYGWQAGAGAVVVVIDPVVFPTATEIGIEAQVTAQLLQPQYVINGSASASGGVSVSISPDIDVAYTGAQTDFPVPEAEGVALAALFALACLARGKSTGERGAS